MLDIGELRYRELKSGVELLFASDAKVYGGPRDIYAENIAIVCLRCQSLGGYGMFALRLP